MKPVDNRRMCPQCRAFITTDDKICPYCNTAVAPKPYVRKTPSDALGGLIPHARFITMLILLINTGMYLATVLYSTRTEAHGGGLELDGQTLALFGAKWVPGILAGQWWRFITAGFLHGGIMHILMNTWVLFDLGAQVEETYGGSRYIVLYLVSTVTGFLASFYWSPTLSIGASAGLCGLIGAMIALGVRDRSSFGAGMRRHYIQWAIYILMIGLLPFFAVDNAAHIGGLAGGFIVGYIAGTPGFSTAIERIWQIAAGVAVAVTGLAFYNVFMSVLSAK